MEDKKFYTGVIGYLPVSGSLKSLLDEWINDYRNGFDSELLAGSAYVLISALNDGFFEKKKNDNKE